MKTFKEFIKVDHFEEEFSSIQETVTTNNNTKIIIKSGNGGVMIENEKGNVTIFVNDGLSSAVFTVEGKDVPALKEFFKKV